jgi:hypothetical protein
MSRCLSTASHTALITRRQMLVDALAGGGAFSLLSSTAAACLSPTTSQPGKGASRE